MPNRGNSFSEKYDLKEELGQGSFSTVYRCVDRKTRQEYAAKVINKERLDRRAMIKLESEARICKRLNHPNIVRLYQIVSEAKTHYFVFDLVTGGELFDDIVRQDKYTEELAAKCMAQLFDTMKYVHKQGVVHRDLKPENILLQSKETKVIKLADFGLAVEVEENELKWFGLAGTPNYMAPEVLELKPYGKPVDMWACGVIMYILLVGYQPFHHENEWRLRDMIKTGDYEMSSSSWRTVTVEAKDLITRLICVVQSRRYTATQALEHSWFKKVKSAIMHRQDTVDRLKSFNAKRKFRAAVHTIHMIKSLRKATSRLDHRSIPSTSSTSSVKSSVKSSAR